MKLPEKSDVMSKQVPVQPKGRMLLAEAFLVHPSLHSGIPSLNSDSICCFYQSDKHLSRDVHLLLQGGRTVHTGETHCLDSNLDVTIYLAIKPWLSHLKAENDKRIYLIIAKD